MESRMAGPSSPTPRTAILGIFFLLVLVQSSHGSTELPPPETQTPDNEWLQLYNKFQSKALILASLEPEYIKCFTVDWYNTTCFWEENMESTMGMSLPYHFYFHMAGEEEKNCTLSTQKASETAMWHICVLPQNDTAFFSTLTVRIMSGENGTTLHERSFQPNDVFLFDPPSNVSVQEMIQSEQLVIRWLPPKTQNLGDTIKYEVKISSPDMDIPKEELIKGKPEFIFTNIDGHTQYSVAVRAILDDYSFKGYWSAWSEVVTVEMSTGLRQLVLVLVSILVLIMLLVSASVFLISRRFLKRKIWPVIPDPFNYFEGLFTNHNGNFQQWLGCSSSYLLGRAHLYNMEGLVASLEVLSELSLNQIGLHLPPVQAIQTDEMPIFTPQLNNISSEHNTATPTPSKMPPLSMDSYIVLGENFMPCTVAPDGTTIRFDGPFSQASIERQEPAGAFSSESSNTEKSEQKGEQGCGQSGSGSSGLPGNSSTEQTSSSSFDYALVDPARLALSSKPRLAQNETDLNYPYLMVSDSGISTDYSSMNCNSGLYSNLYANDVRLGPFSHNQVLYSPC